MALLSLQDQKADSGQMSDNYLDLVYLVSVAAQRRALVLLLLVGELLQIAVGVHYLHFLQF
jgi:hypothetical protein